MDDIVQVIFIILLILIGLLGGAKKKKKRIPPQPVPRRRPRPESRPVPRGRTRPDPRQSIPTGAERGQTDVDLFDILREHLEGVREPEPTPEPAVLQIPETEADDEIVRPAHTEFHEKYIDVPKPVEGVVAPPTRRKRPMVTMDPKTVRQGIVLAEVLRKPKGLR